MKPPNDSDKQPIVLFLRIAIFAVHEHAKTKKVGPV
jgi:hypothetical protein